jgi:SOS-response transcriptional repressor LexA
MEYLDTDELREEVFSLFRYYEDIPASDPFDPDPDGQMYVQVIHSKARPGQYVCRICGNSMEPEIHEGDLILMQRGQVPQPGDIVGAYVKGHGVTLKEFHKYGKDKTSSPCSTAIPRNGLPVDVCWR